MLKKPKGDPYNNYYQDQNPVMTENVEPKLVNNYSYDSEIK